MDSVGDITTEEKGDCRVCNGTILIIFQKDTALNSLLVKFH